MMLILYEILYMIFVLCYLPFFLIRGKYHSGLMMRLGIIPRQVMNKLSGQKVIWLHTVSVGEANAASCLVEYLKRQYPDYRLVISTVTKTGNKVAQHLAGPGDAVIYSPLDIGVIVRKVIRLLNPKLLIVAETELWPNLVVELAGKKVPIVLINGRVSYRSFQGYRLIRQFIKQILDGFTCFCMQTEEDARRMLQLGAAEERLKVTGNMKFDIQMPDTGYQMPDLGLSSQEQLFIAGSTHRGEEAIILQVYKELIKQYPKLRLLIAPRHIERVKEIEKLVSKFDFNSQKVSQPDLPPAACHLPPILILDTIGQLKSLYAPADIVFIGGSLVRHGGQNPIEPAIFSKAIIFGPHMDNFSNVAASFLNRQAAMLVKGAQELQEACGRLLAEPELGRQMGVRANSLIQENQGASLRNMEFIHQVLQNEP